MATPLSPSTLRSFGLSDQLALEPLPGGRGLCYRTEALSYDLSTTQQRRNGCAG